MEFWAAGKPHHRQARRIETGDQARRGPVVTGIAPGGGNAVVAGEVEHPHRRLRRLRTDDLHADPLHRLQGLAAGDERRQEQIAERAILEQQRTQDVALDSDVPERLRDRRRHEHRLPREQVHLAEEARRPMPDDLVAGGVNDRHLPVENGDERVAAIADAVEDIADVSAAFLA